MFVYAVVLFSNEEQEILEFVLIFCEVLNVLKLTERLFPIFSLHVTQTIRFT